MKARHRIRYEAGLAAAVDRLRSTGTATYDDAWQATVEVLAWLYRCEEAERQADPDYYRHRDSTEDGRTLGGLMWLRAQVEHHQAEIRDLVLEPITTEDGDNLTTEDGEAIVGRFHVVRWPRRAAVPTDEVLEYDPDEPLLGPGLPWQHADKWGRDVMYEASVEGEELLPPLERAQRFFVNRRP